MRPDLLSEVMGLPPTERLELIEALWDTLSPGEFPVTEEERRALDQRIAEMETSPGDESPWSEVKARLAERRS